MRIRENDGLPAREGSALAGSCGTQSKAFCAVLLRRTSRGKARGLLDSFIRMALLAFVGSLILGSMSCSRSEANQYDPGEANVLVVSAFAAKDGECGTTHNFTSIIFFPADRANVEACVVAVLDTSCTNWSVANPTPSVCSFIGVQFES